MTRTICLAVGVLLLLVGLVGFLGSSVMLASTQEVTGITSPGGTKLSLPPDDPTVKSRKSQAENVLMGSLLIFVVGAVVSIAGWRIPRGQRVDRPPTVSEKVPLAEGEGKRPLASPTSSQASETSEKK